MAKKDKTPKLPKKVGGVKLPKQLRKSAGAMAELAQNPVAREVVSAALVAGVTALARRKDKVAAAAEPVKSAAASELDALVTQGKEVGNIVAQGITSFFGALLKPSEKSDASAAAKPAAAKPAAKRPAAKTTARKPAATKAAATKSAAARPAAAKRAPARPRAKPAPKPKPAS
jgi:hypothetical protein